MDIAAIATLAAGTHSTPVAVRYPYHALSSARASLKHLSALMAANNSSTSSSSNSQDSNGSSTSGRGNSSADAITAVPTFPFPSGSTLKVHFSSNGTQLYAIGSPYDGLYSCDVTAIQCTAADRAAQRAAVEQTRVSDATAAATHAENVAVATWAAAERRKQQAFDAEMAHERELERQQIAFEERREKDEQEYVREQQQQQQSQQQQQHQLHDSDNSSSIKSTHLPSIHGASAVAAEASESESTSTKQRPRRIRGLKIAVSMDEDSTPITSPRGRRESAAVKLPPHSARGVTPKRPVVAAPLSARAAVTEHTADKHASTANTKPNTAFPSLHPKRRTLINEDAENSNSVTASDSITTAASSLPAETAEQAAERKHVFASELLPLGAHQLSLHSALPADQQFHSGLFVMSLDGNILAGYRHCEPSGSDGKLVACRKLMVVDKSKGSVTVCAKSHMCDASTISIAPDNSAIIVGTREGHTYWHALNGNDSNRYLSLYLTTTGTAPTDQTGNLDLCFSPDSRYIIASRMSRDKPLTIWTASATKPKLVASLEAHEKSYIKACFIPPSAHNQNSADHVLSVGFHPEDLSIHYWSSAARTIFPKSRLIGRLNSPYTQFKAPADFYTHAVAVSPNGLLAAIGYGLTLFIINLSTYKVIQYVTCYELMSSAEQEADLELVRNSNSLSYSPNSIAPSVVLLAERAPEVLGVGTVTTTNSSSTTSSSLAAPTSRGSRRATSKRDSQESSLTVPSRRGSRSRPNSSGGSNVSMLPAVTQYTTYFTTLSFSAAGNSLACGTSLGAVGIFELSKAVLSGKEDSEHSDGIAVPMRRAAQKKEFKRQAEAEAARLAAAQQRQREAEERQRQRDTEREAQRWERQQRAEARKEAEDIRRRRLYNGLLPDLSAPLPAYPVRPALPAFNRTQYNQQLLEGVMREGNFLTRLDKDVTFRKSLMCRWDEMKQEAEQQELQYAQRMHLHKGPPEIIKQRQQDFLQKLNRDLQKRREFEQNAAHYYDKLTGKSEKKGKKKKH